MRQKKKPVPRRKHSLKKEQHSSPTGRKQRHDVGETRLLPRDELALTWIGQQLAMRLDQIQELLGQFAGHGAAHDDQISESSTRSAIARWKKAGWIYARRIDAQEPMWVWLTQKGLKRVGLPYQYQSLASLSEQDRKHLYAITDVRLELGDGAEGLEWTSERTLLQGTHRRRGHKRVHRPDAVLALGNDLIAIEVELSRKTESLLSEILVALLCERDYHGQAYHDLKAQVGEDKAQWQRPLAWRHYTQVYYYADEKKRRYVRDVLAKVVQKGYVSEEQAQLVRLWWYPLATTDEEIAREQQEMMAPLVLDAGADAFLYEGRERDD